MKPGLSAGLFSKGVQNLQILAVCPDYTRLPAWPNVATFQDEDYAATGPEPNQPATPESQRPESQPGDPIDELIAAIMAQNESYR